MKNKIKKLFLNKLIEMVILQIKKSYYQMQYLYTLQKIRQTQDSVSQISLESNKF